MDAVVAAVVVTALLGVVAVVALLVIRGPLKLTVRGPFRTGVDVEGKPPGGVRLDRVRAGRNLKARGQAVDARRVRAGQDASFDDRGDGQPQPPQG
ncbi:MAG TPA: hypothetical protein VMU20_02835 [Candidatus Dormibacteraeota bacterium]|jgi:hypothetical protein|nr:hypothetical protein [Candidatus Dormibacteraeota bacterium]